MWPEMTVSFTFLQYTKIYIIINNAFACVLVHYIPFVIVRIHVDTHLNQKYDKYCADITFQATGFFVRSNE